MAFYVGQKVICVDADCNTSCNPDAVWVPGEELYNNNIYTVRSVHLDLDGNGEKVLWLDEVRRSNLAIQEWGPFVGYGVYRFRPVVEKKTDISVFTAMLTNTKIKRQVVRKVGV